MALTILNHPLATHIMTHLRDKTTKPATFRTLTYQISLLLTLEATKSLQLAPKEISTPLENCTGNVFSRPLVIIPILRAGLGMAQPYLDTFPDVSVGYVGLERDHVTAQAHTYYCKLPPHLNHSDVIVIDPMLATGGSAIEALKIVKAQGAKSIKFTCIVSSPEGIAALQKAHPDVDIFTASVDRELNKSKYILPGLGDFGDRLFGT